MNLRIFYGMGSKLNFLISKYLGDFYRQGLNEPIFFLKCYNGKARRIFIIIPLHCTQHDIVSIKIDLLISAADNCHKLLEYSEEKIKQRGEKREGAQTNPALLRLSLISDATHSASTIKAPSSNFKLVITSFLNSKSLLAYKIN